MSRDRMTPKTPCCDAELVELQNSNLEECAECDRVYLWSEIEGKLMEVI